MEALSQINQTVQNISSQAKTNYVEGHDNLNHRIDLMEARSEGTIKSIHEKLELLVNEISAIQRQVKDHKIQFQQDDKNIIAELEKVKTELHQIQLDFKVDSNTNNLKWGVNKNNWTIILSIGLGALSTIITQFIINYFKTP